MPGIIEDENVTFIKTGAKPDTLETTVNGAAGNAAAPASGVISCGDKVWNAYKTLRSTLNQNISLPIEECYKNIIVNFLQLEYISNGSDRKAKFKLDQLSPENLIECLKTTYGDYIAETDIGDKIKAEMAQGGMPDEVASLFPEIQALSRINPIGYYLGTYGGSDSVITQPNPYLLVLCAAPDYKAFLAGCIELAEKEGAFAEVDFNANINVKDTNHQKEKLTKYIVKYAQQIKQKEISPILKELQRIPVKTGI
jgi:hypothetical protein